MDMMNVTQYAPLLAYIDPGTGSLALQAIIGGLLGAVYVCRSYWGNIKARVGKLVGRRNSEGS